MSAHAQITQAITTAELAELRKAASVRLGDRRGARERESGARLGRLEVERLANEVINAVLDEHAADRHQKGKSQLDNAAEASVKGAIFDWLFGLGPFEAILARRDVVNVHVTGAGPVFVDLVDGTKDVMAPVVATPQELTTWVRRQAVVAGRRFDSAHPYVTMRLPEGSRLTAIGWRTKQPEVWIRCHHFVCPILDELVRTEQPMLTPEVADFLRAAVLAGMNILVSGGQNTGKTTLLRALANEIPPEERIVTVEKSFELDLDLFPERHPDMTAMEASDMNAEGVGEESCSLLLTRAMRMAATWLILGEALDDGVIPLLKAMNCGASSMCTIHANSSEEAFTRLAILAMDADNKALAPTTTMYMAASAIDLSVALTRLPSGRRVVSSIREVVRADGEGVITNELFALSAAGDAARTATAPREATRARLRAAGYVEAQLPAGAYR